ncbi:MAG: GNAT family N-acetyltransferase [Nitrospinaceae bacterium]|nr:GNAT family N-acetyltransferase [Nitrospinaceae bacterium]MBT5868667.1 GNAT family N-acetyltransferase [Nitrospinaceae bacterium]MBT6346896.1 GNAT family N-acetyltransferase [Nitrospina sp.]
MTPELVDLFASFPSLSLTNAEHELYRKLRCREPQLISCSDNLSANAGEEVFALSEKGQPLGVVSMVIQENQNKPTPKNNYVRLDLVIVDKKYRNLGVGRALIICSLLEVLRNWERKIYSISCLAGHKTVETYLQELSFQAHPRKEKDYWQGSLNLTDLDPHTLIKIYLKKAKICLQWTSSQLHKKNSQ